MTSLGVCFGASSLQCVLLTVALDAQKSIQSWRIVHDGNPQHAFINFLSSIDTSSIHQIAVTGRSLRHSVALSHISEPQAIECGLAHYKEPHGLPRYLISLGGETQVIYSISDQGTVLFVQSGNKCASGTGEFFLQQVRRMGLTVEQAVELAMQGTPHKIAGRCSVFCKSDCTHALNGGADKADVCAGLCVMMADKVCEQLGALPKEPVAIIGGGSYNTALYTILAKRFSSCTIPEYAAVFEALGAALYAQSHTCLSLPQDFNRLFIRKSHSFGIHPSLRAHEALVTFKPSVRGQIKSDESLILGLDVGSTTTKAVLMTHQEHTIVASVYLRTNGDPVGAACRCYTELQNQLAPKTNAIIAIGVTGSGRYIAALHALTDNVINEIMAHAAAAAYFDKEVDTIFEIGGQDAKYTSLTAGVPTDYAMNEACSAGTGSFLEESAQEFLGIKTTEIGDLASRAHHPANFTDQCAAFISSDIKRAGQEGIERNDILAGLVYSICMNYLNRVKGNRPVGKKIFMQGGVCYNRAVPVAMAALMQMPIVVPSDPGLMGAFGVALKVEERLLQGHIKPVPVNLQTLILRKTHSEGTFVCAGGKEKCDRKCTVARIKIEGKIYPFGGACDKYSTIHSTRKKQPEELDYVAIRQKLLFEKYSVFEPPVSRSNETCLTIGINRSFLTYSLLPLYTHFFTGLGCKVVVPDLKENDASTRPEAAFCLPVELAHAGFLQLLNRKVDVVFVPQVMQIPVANVPTYSRLCVFAQGEPYYLKTTFREQIEASATLVASPVLKLEKGYASARHAFVKLAIELGFSVEKAQTAYSFACERQYAFEAELKEHGKKALDYLDKHPETFGIVLFGRPYNAYANEANMSIPQKITSRGHVTIPLDMLPIDAFQVDKKMFWAMGQKIMKAAQLVAQRDNLYGVFITNFSCGPDSFLLKYFRDAMKQKPSLTLELDQHTADAGITTRIEAALDIMRSFGKLAKPVHTTDAYQPARIEPSGNSVVSSDNKRYALTDQMVEVIVPSMGHYATESLVAVLKSIGINAVLLPVATSNVFLEGKKHTSGKECLPYIVTTGSFMSYLKTKKDAQKVSLLFMATGGGPCRLGQYCKALELLISQNKMRNVAIFTITDENGYGGMGARTLLKAWQAIVIADIFGDVRSMLSVAASDKTKALQQLEHIWQDVIFYFSGKSSQRLSNVLVGIRNRLARIPLKRMPHEIPVISVVGEIYVRRDEFSRKTLVDYLENEGFMVKVAPTAEYLCYSNYVVNNGLGERQFSLGNQLKMKLTAQVQEWWERRIKSILGKSGVYKYEMIDVAKTIEDAGHLLNPNFRGECILTVGLSMREILHDSCGVIAIGPFGCMYSRMAEAMLKKEMTVEGKKRMPGWEAKADVYNEHKIFPFLSIETDGGPFPQLVEANLEAFVLQARRLYKTIELQQEGKVRKKTSVLFANALSRILPG